MVTEVQVERRTIPVTVEQKVAVFTWEVEFDELLKEVPALKDYMLNKLAHDRMLQNPVSGAKMRISPYGQGEPYALLFEVSLPTAPPGLT